MASCTTYHFSLTSPIGKMLVEYCHKGLHCVKQVEYTTDELFKPNKSVLVTLLNCDSHEKRACVVTETLNWFRAYFTDPVKTTKLLIPNICVASKDGSFREKLWLLLAENVKSGCTISYRELATLVSKPGAARAVGTAMSNNPIQIIVPCHRVIKSDGSFGNYAKGCRNGVKKWLLNHEGIQ